MDPLRSNQITSEQKIILKHFAESVAREGVQFLEIGSWLGDSTIVLGKVAQKYNGKLVCVDWWKGNPGTGLEIIASRNDIFSKFWERVCKEGLEEVIIPIKARSEEALKHLKDNSYDLIFIDGDHRYQQTLLDINNSKNLVNTDGGILCGHDCEGYRSDYDEDFLEEGKNIDYHETVHCGVVLAVSTVFDNYSINHSIWSTTYNRESQKWIATNPSIKGITHRKQSPPPIFASSENYNAFRYKKKVYAVPKDLANFDIANGDQSLPIGVITRNSYEEIKRSLLELFNPDKNHPTLLNSYKKFNIVNYNDRIYALHQSLGKCNLQTIKLSELKKYLKNNQIIIGKSEDEVKKFIEYKPSTCISSDCYQSSMALQKNPLHRASQKLDPINGQNSTP